MSVVTTAERIGNDGGVDQNLVFSTEMGGPPKPGEGPVKIKYDYIVPMGKDTKFTARMNYKNAADELKHKSDDRTFRAEMPTR